MRLFQRHSVSIVHPETAAMDRNVIIQEAVDDESSQVLCAASATLSVHDSFSQNTGCDSKASELPYLDSISRHLRCVFKVRLWTEMVSNKAAQRD